MKGEGHTTNQKGIEMYIDVQTAQLILDAIAWSNKDWMESLDWVDGSDGVEEARTDFVRFCRVHGIEGVEVTK